METMRVDSFHGGGVSGAAMNFYLLFTLAIAVFCVY